MSELYPKTLENSKRVNCTEDFFFADRDFSTIRPILFNEYEIGMHHHDFYEINIVLSGKGVHYIEQKLYQVKKGDAFVIPPGLNHGYYNLEHLQVYHILVSKRFISKYNIELNSLDGFFPLFNIQPIIRVNTDYSFFLKLSSEDIADLNPLLSSFLRIYTEDERYANENDLLQCAKGLEIIIQLCKLYKKNISTKEKALKLGTKNNAFVESLKFIYDNYSQKLSAVFLAKNANMSYSAYDRMFKKILGISPMEFVINHRITIAKELLKSTDLSITEIAMQTGFYDSSHFNKMFIKQVKICPSDYRLSKRQAI